METPKYLKEKKYNQYKTSAEFYDLDFKGISYDDIEFYLGLVKPHYNEILELCCGTGRISIPFAKNGISVSALDFSKEMLSIFKTKLTHLDKEVSNRITLIESDMATFILNREFKCILIPFHSFQSLTDTFQISQTLEKINRHLANDGLFILNIFKPLVDMKAIEGVCETKTITDSKGQGIYKKECVNTFVDISNQVLYYDLNYYLFTQSDTIVTEHLKAKYYYLHQIIELLEKHNFSIDKVYHGFNQNEAVNIESSELTLLCKRRLI